MFDKQQYLDNEDNNYHTENGIALANEFGTPEEQKLMAQIQKDHYARGHINPDEIEARNAIVKKYYPMLEGLDEDMMSEAGGYYTQPVYDMIEKHGIQKVMHELLTSLDADVIQDFISRAEFTESEKRWKQTSMSPEQAEKEYGKENVKVKRGGLRNGDDMVQVFVEDKAKGVRGALSKLPHIGRHIHGHDHKPTQPPSLKGMKIVPNDIPNQPSPQDDPPQSKNPSQPTPSPHMDPPQPKQPSEPKQDRQPKQPERPRQKQPRKAIYASKLKEKIF